jgi:hypothetical protein
VSTGRLLLDEMISPRVAEQLRQRGHNVIAVAERTDLVGMSDADVLTLGAQEVRVVVTLDIGDFARLGASVLSEGRSHSGILYAATAAFPRRSAIIGALVRSLDAAIRSGDLPGHNQEGFLRRLPG